MSARDDILAGLRAAEDSVIGDATPQEALDAYRAQVLHEAADLVGAYTGSPFDDSNAKMLRRVADGTPRPGDPTLPTYGK